MNSRPDAGRQREARFLARANRVMAVVRLCSGKVDDWGDFLRGTETDELLCQTRYSLRRQAAEAKPRMRKLVDGFNRYFFIGGTEVVFERLFEDIKSGIPLGLRMPVSEFEKRFAPLRREVGRGRDQERPFHATISITLVGLRYEYPEWHFANDIVIAITDARDLERELAPFSGNFDPALKRKWIDAQDLARRQVAVLRWCLISCSSLIEAYLGSLAWRLHHTERERMAHISSRDRRTVEDSGSTFRDRLVRIPRIVSGRRLWDENDPTVQAILGLKQIRDALMHPSPFSTPEKYGGKNKLSLIYDLEHKVAEHAVEDTSLALTRIFRHIYGNHVPFPSWMTCVGELVDGATEEADQPIPANKPAAANRASRGR